MATKNYNLPPETNNTSISDNGSQYGNLSLNQNLKSTKINPIQSKSISNDNKNDQSVLFETVSQKDSWNKLDTNDQLLSQKFNPLNLDNDNQKKKADESSSNVNSSTLSLHIVAYENSIDSSISVAQNGDLLEEKARKSKFGKPWKTVKQLFNGSTSTQSSSPEIKAENVSVKAEVLKFQSSKKVFDGDKLKLQSTGVLGNVARFGMYEAYLFNTKRFEPYSMPLSIHRELDTPYVVYSARLGGPFKREIYFNPAEQKFDRFEKLNPPFNLKISSNAKANVEVGFSEIGEYLTLEVLDENGKYNEIKKPLNLYAGKDVVIRVCQKKELQSHYSTLSFMVALYEAGASSESWAKKKFEIKIE